MSIKLKVDSTLKSDYIPLDKCTIIDSKYYDEIIRHTLSWTIGGFVNIYIKLKDGSFQVMPLHRYIITHLNNYELMPRYTIHHINSKRYDNRLQNLMITIPILKQTIFKDIKFHFNTWKVYITYKEKQHYIGIFDTYEEAAYNYDMCYYAIFSKTQDSNEFLDEHLLKIVDMDRKIYIPKDIKINTYIPSFVAIRI